MRELLYREARLDDVQGMAEVRLGDWETAEFWRDRIAQYLSGEHSPGQALKPRIAYVALEGDHVVGLIAGHLTRRHGCKGELQWISVKPEYRRQGVASSCFAAWRHGSSNTMHCEFVSTCSRPTKTRGASMPVTVQPT